MVSLQGMRKQLETTRPRYRVHHLTARGWVVLDPAGNRCSDGTGFKPEAQALCDRLQAEADRKRKRGPRPCLCCGKAFESQGIHNRLCEGCRRSGSPLGDPVRPVLPTAGRP